MNRKTRKIVGGVHIKNIYDAVNSFFLKEERNVGEFYNKYTKDGRLNNEQLLKDIFEFIQSEKRKYFDEIQIGNIKKSVKLDIFKNIEPEIAKELKQKIINTLSKIFKNYFLFKKSNSLMLLKTPRYVISDKDLANNFTIEKYVTYLIDNIKNKTEEEAKRQKEQQESVKSADVAANRNEKLKKANTRKARLDNVNKPKPPINIDDSLHKSLLLSLNDSLKKEKPMIQEPIITDNLLQESLLLNLNEAFKEPIEEEEKVEDNSLKESLLLNLNGAFKKPQEDNSLKESLILNLNGAFKEPIEEEEKVEDNSLQESLQLNLNKASKETIEEEKLEDNSLQESLQLILNGAFKEPQKEEEKISKMDNHEFIKLIIKNPPKNEDAKQIIEMLEYIISQEPQEIDKIGNTHFHYIAGSFYEKKHDMFNLFGAETQIKCFNYQNAEGTTPLMILLSKCEKIEDLQNEAEYVNFAEDIEQEDIYGNSIFSILTKKMVEFSRKEETQNTNSAPNLIEKIIYNKFNHEEDMPQKIEPIDPLENTVLHYVAGSYLSTEDKIKLMNKNSTLRENINRQNVEGATPMMILIKHATKTDLTDDVKQFIAENIADLEQEDIYGNSVFSILTKKIVEFSEESKKEKEYSEEEKESDDESLKSVSSSDDENESDDESLKSVSSSEDESEDDQ
jgi:hypothetical protein